MIYARKCSFTGKGMNEGWYIDGAYCSDYEIVEEFAKSQGYDDWNDMYNNANECYFTEWDVEDEFEQGQEEFYLEDGTEILITLKVNDGYIT